MTLTDIKINSFITEDRYKEDYEDTTVVCIKKGLLYVSVIGIEYYSDYPDDNVITVSTGMSKEDRSLVEMKKEYIDTVLTKYFGFLTGD